MALCLGMLLCTLPSLALPFSPIVKNYSSSDYLAARQNWSVSQAPDGIVYVANGSALLSFDNHTWKRFPVPHGGLVRSVYCAPDGRIWCGTYRQFGYFEKEGNSLRYTAVSGPVEALMEDEDIWNILQDPASGNMVFQSFSALYFWDGKTLQRWADGAPLNLLSCGKKLFSQMIEGPLLCVSDGQAEPLIPKGGLDGAVVAVQPHPDGVLFFTDAGGIWQYRDGKAVRVFAGVSAQLANKGVNRVIRTRDDCYVIGTIQDGLYVIDSGGKLLYRCNMDNHLQNSTVLGLHCDADNNIWVALDDGVSYLEHASGVYVWSSRISRVGMIYDYLPHGEGSAYVATNQGLWHCDGDEGLRKIPECPDQSWTLRKLGSTIICGNNRGLYEVRGNRAYLITNQGAGAFCFEEIDRQRDTTYYMEGTYFSPNLFYSVPGKPLKELGMIDNLRQMIRHTEYDHLGNIWCEHVKGGIVRLRLSSDKKRVDEMNVYKNLGPVTDSLFSVLKLASRVVFSNGRAFYTYEDLSGKIVPYDAMNEQLGMVRNVHQCVQVADDSYWLVSDTEAVMIEARENRFRVIRSVPFRLFGVSVEERASMRYDESTGDSYLLMNNLLARIRTKRYLSQVRHTEKELLLTDLVASDKDGRRKVLSVEQGTHIPPRYNSLSFVFSYPVYNEFDTRFRYRLEGLSDEWVESGQRLTIDFPRLKSGSYTLHVQACSGDSVITGTDYSFSINYPWYKQWWMMILYVLSACAITMVIRFHSERRRQHEQELALARQAAENIHQLDEKLTSLLTRDVVEDNEAWGVFQSNFDLVHDHYFQHLKDAYPSLTSTDLRFCALLRLNMSTKEIANMMNLTIRGVESARFRLRKKFGISPDESLTDFIFKFK